MLIVNSIRLPYHILVIRERIERRVFKVVSDNGVYTAYFLNTQMSVFFVIGFIMVNHEIDCKKP